MSSQPTSGSEQHGSESQPITQPVQHIANIIVESMKDVPPEILATRPKDRASQHDRYLYGWPKKSEE